MSENANIHTFMFPFRWDYIPRDSNLWGKKIPKEYISYSERTQLSDFNKLFEKCNTLKRTTYEIGKNRDKYNEYTYFHSFARKALYDIDCEENINQRTLLYYELNGQEDDSYKIEVKYSYWQGGILKDYKKDFDIPLKSVCMHVYNTGVGILTFNLENTNYKTEEDILHINEFGRRVYPQFMSGEEGILAPKNTFLATKISGQIGGIQFEEDFSQYATENIKTNAAFLAPDFIKKIFGYKGQDKEGDDAVGFVFNRGNEKKGKIRISQVTDDRMFFMCYYDNKDLIKTISNTHENQGEWINDYQLNDFWYCFIFGDKREKTIAYPQMQIEHLQQHTYARWIKLGTLYGMTRDSFVCVANWDLIQKHMQTMYYQMSVLCLVQRASVLRFAYEVSNITELLNTSGNINPRIKDLYKNYIEFINKIYFREVTSQIQGIEMYNQFQQVMNLEKEVKDLDGEIQELHTYVSMDEQGKISQLATLFLPAGVVIGLMGSAFKSNIIKLGASPDLDGFLWVILAILLSILIGYLVSLYLKFKK